MSLPPPTPRSPWTKWLIRAGSLLLAAAVLTLAWRALAPELRALPPQQALAALKALPHAHLAAALGLTACSYLLLTFYDRLALRMVGLEVPLGTTMRAAFTSYTLSHTLGFGAVTGGSARLRIYGGVGVPAGKVARIVVIAGVAFWLGVVTAASLALLVNPAPVTLAGLTLPASPARLAGGGLLALVAALALATRYRPGWFAPLARFITLPHPGSVLALVGVSTIELSTAALALYVLLPHPDGWHFAAFILAYAMGLVAGLITHVPGGLGVFEAVLLAAMPEFSPRLADTHTGAAALAALLGYRIIYYLLPLVLAIALNLLIEGRRLVSALAKRRS